MEIETSTIASEPLFHWGSINHGDLHSDPVDLTQRYPRDSHQRRTFSRGSSQCPKAVMVCECDGSLLALPG